MSRQRRALLAACLITAAWGATADSRQDAAPPGRAVAGQVVAADDGAPIANARILLNLQPLGWTDASGHFDVVLPRGSSPLQIEKAGFVLQPIGRTGRDLLVRMVRSAALTVRVVDEHGEPAPWRPFRLAGPNGLLLRVVDDRGQRRLVGLPPGRYTADIENLPPPQATSSADRTAQQRQIAEARERTARRAGRGLALSAGGEGHITLTLQPPGDPPARRPRNAGSIRGVVSGPGGTPLHGARVVLRGTRSETSTVADSTGGYAFDAVPPGPYRIYAEFLGLLLGAFGQDAPDATASDVVLMAGEALDGIDVTLRRGGTVAGRLADGRGEPYAGVNVMVVAPVSEGGSDRLDLRPVAGDSTDDRGRFRISGIPAGPHTTTRFVEQAPGGSS